MSSVPSLNCFWAYLRIIILCQPSFYLLSVFLALLLFSFSSSNHLNKHTHIIFIIIIRPSYFKSASFSGNPISSPLPCSPATLLASAVIKEKRNPVFRNMRFACWIPQSHAGLRMDSAGPAEAALCPLASMTGCQAVWV